MKSNRKTVSKPVSGLDCDQIALRAPTTTSGASSAMTFAATTLTMRQAQPRWRLRPARSASAEKGQALIWLLGTLAASAAVLYAVFSVGQLHVAKAKTVNAADAAALAGATVEARMLNLIAYNNRSMIANEVLYVQVLSIDAWFGYLVNTANNFGTAMDIVGAFIPPFAAVGKVLDQTANKAKKLRDRTVKQVIHFALSTLEASKTGAATMHQSLRIAGGFAAEDAASKVVAANRSEFGLHQDAGVEIDNSTSVRLLTFGLNEKRWMAFSKQYSDLERTDARQVLLDSRDDFSDSRPGRPWFNVDAKVAGVEKHGGSRLHDFDRWETQDTLEVWARDWRGKKQYVPIGWGRDNSDEQGNPGDRWSPGRTAQSLAWNDGQEHKQKGWRGVPAVFDIADKTEASRASLGIDFLVAVRRPKDNNMTSSTLGIGGTGIAHTGSSEMPERLHGDQLSALAKARVSFMRPQRDSKDWTIGDLSREDKAKEYGSLFSPYWQARLVDLTKAEKIALAAAMGVDPASALLTPGGQSEAAK